MPKPLTLETIKERIKEKGFTFVTGNYDNKYNSTITFSCPAGHVITRSWEQLRKLKNCPECSRLDLFKSKLELEVLSKLADLDCNLSELYRRGNAWWVKYTDNTNDCYDVPTRKLLQPNYAGQLPSRNHKYSNDEVSSILSAEGYTLLSDYKNAHTPFEVSCPNGHLFKISRASWFSGSRCPYCSGRSELNWDVVKLRLQEHGLELLHYEEASLDFLNSVITVRCEQQHTYETTYHNLRSVEFRCKECSHIAKIKEIDDIEVYLAACGYKLVGEYKNSGDKLELMCPNGHIYQSTWDNFYYNQRRCKRCNPSTSRMEVDLLDQLEGLEDNIITNDRTVIAPYELDIVIPDKKLAIELCGLYWHSELRGGKGNKYHLHKLELCQAAGYRLITIFEDEYKYKRDIVVSRIKSILGHSSTILYARKCNVTELGVGEARDFLEKYHIQGASVNSRYCLGAYHLGELVAVMTFSDANISRSFVKTDGVWELDRFCVKADHSIVGIASKLLKYFESNNDWDELFSFADRRWSAGGVYHKLGFDLVWYTKPSYWYFKPNDVHKTRKHRFSGRKTDKDDPKLTEFDNRKLEGYDRIWDCGHIKFSKNRK